jgi:hypothetical protein
LSQVSDSTGPLNQWPRGQRTLALSSGPSDDRTAYRYSTSAGSPHLTAPSSSIYSGQSMKIMSVSTATPAQSIPAAPHWTAPGSRHAPAAGRAHGGPSPPGRNKSSTEKEHLLAHLIHLRCTRRLAGRYQPLGCAASGVRIMNSRDGTTRTPNGSSHPGRRAERYMRLRADFPVGLGAVGQVRLWVPRASSKARER